MMHSLSFKGADIHHPPLYPVLSVLHRLLWITKTIQACKIGNGFENFFENNFFRFHKSRSPPIVYEQKQTKKAGLCSNGNQGNSSEIDIEKRQGASAASWRDSSRYGNNMRYRYYCRYWTRNIMPVRRYKTPHRKLRFFSLFTRPEPVSFYKNNAIHDFLLTAGHRWQAQ